MPLGLYSWCKEGGEEVEKYITVMNRGDLRLRGYCTPDHFCDCLGIFLKKYNTLVTSKVWVLKVIFIKNPTTALEFH